MKPDLAELLFSLQRELRLLDWRVEVAYVRDLAMNGRPVHGLCQSHVDGKVAQIAIRDPETPCGDSDPPVEETLIHELLHLHFAPLSGESSAERAAEEQAVWAITEALHTAKSASRRALIARAMVAHAKGFTGPRASRPQVRKQEMDMDMAMLLAALKAAIASGDMKQVEALAAQLESMVGGPPSEQEPLPEEEPKAQEPPPPPEEAKAARPVPRALPRAAVPAGPAGPAAGYVTRTELDRAMTAIFVAQQGGHLSEAQRAFASSLSSQKAREFLALNPAPRAEDSAARAKAPGVRLSRPTSGGPSAAGGDPSVVEVDRRMGLAPVSAQVFGRHPVTGRLQLSNIATNAVAKAGE